MSDRGLDGRALALALLATLLIRLLAWGAGGNAVVHAGRLNQTIPTMTPSGMPGTPATPRDDASTPSPPRPTRPQSEPSATPMPVESAAASPTATGQPVEGTEAATAVPGSPTPVPAEITPTGAVFPTSGAAFIPTEVLSSPSPTATPSPVPLKTLVPAPSTGTPTCTPTVIAAPVAGIGAVFFSPSCLWPVGALVLVGAGSIALLKRRQTE